MTVKFMRRSRSTLNTLILLPLLLQLRPLLLMISYTDSDLMASSTHTLAVSTTSTQADISTFTVKNNTYCVFAGTASTISTQKTDTSEIINNGENTGVTSTGTTSLTSIPTNTFMVKDTTVTINNSNTTNSSYVTNSDEMIMSSIVVTQSLSAPCLLSKLP